MLKNTKVLSNNGKIMKGIHLESFILYDNQGTSGFQISIDGATVENPVYTFLYDTNGYTFNTYTSNETDVTTSLYTATSDKYILTYGNNDSITKFNFNYDYINGDLKGFLDNYINLKDLRLPRSYVTQNMDYFEWPNLMENLELQTTTSLTGDFGTFTGLDNLKSLSINSYGFTGSIENFNNLTYLVTSGSASVNNLTGSVNDWAFQPNLTYLNLNSNYSLTGDITNWQFPTNLTYFYIYRNTGLEGDISNWDFSNCSSNISYFYISNYTGNNNIIGNLSGWTFKDDITIGTFSLNYCEVTGIILDLTNINMTGTFSIQYCLNMTSTLNDIQLPDGILNLNIIGNNTMGGDIATFYFPSTVVNVQCWINAWGGDVFAIDTNNISGSTTNFRVYNNELIGNISGCTLWEGLAEYHIHGNNITGTLSAANTTIPTSLLGFHPYNNEIILDLSSTFDFKNVVNFFFNNISGITGDFSNLILNSVETIYLSDNSFDMDLGNLDLGTGWDTIITISAYNTTTNGNSDITSWFPSGSTPSMYNLSIYSTDIGGDITDWSFLNFSQNTYTTISLYASNLYGDIGNWGCSLARTVRFQDTDISGDVGKLDLLSEPTTVFTAQRSGLYGHLSGVTLSTTFSSFLIEDCSGVTGSNEFMEYLWINRKNWTQYFSVNISGITDAPTGTYELGDLGTYGGNAWDLTEAEINNLVLGNDYNGLGSNTPWDQLQKYYYHKEARASGVSSTAKYKISAITYNGS